MGTLKGRWIVGVEENAVKRMQHRKLESNQRGSLLLLQDVEKTGIRIEHQIFVVHARAQDEL